MTSTEPIHSGSLVDGRYRVDELIGEGGFGRVFRGVHLILEAPIAIKTLRLNLGGDEAERALRFLDEARLLSKLRHPNIVRVIDAGVHASTPPQGWLVVEWCEGVTLGDELAETTGAARSVRQVWELLGPLVDAVATAHEANIVHRDIKPSNVMITRGPKGSEARLIDFGIAKMISMGEEQPSESRTSGRVAFTTAYAAPEQLAALRTGPWTDVHALGLILTEVLTGEAPYPCGRELESILDQVNRPTPQRFGVHVGSWEAVLERAVAFKSSDRFQSARALHNALADALPDLAHDRTSSVSDTFVARARSQSGSGSGGTERDTAQSDSEPRSRKQDPSTITAAASSREIATTPSVPRPKVKSPKAAWAVPALLAAGLATWALVRAAGEDSRIGALTASSSSPSSTSTTTIEPEGTRTGEPVTSPPAVRTIDSPLAPITSVSAAVSASGPSRPLTRPSVALAPSVAAPTPSAVPTATSVPTTSARPTLQ